MEPGESSYREERSRLPIAFVAGLLIMAIVGGAILPVAQGALADSMGIHHAFILPVLCYIYIAYYAFRGSRPVIPAAG